MPCQDTTSQIVCTFDHQDRLLNYQYTKQTCQRSVGLGEGYLEVVRNMPIDAVYALTFDDVVRQVPCLSEDDQFLLFLEWVGLRRVIEAFLGYEPSAALSAPSPAATNSDEPQNPDLPPTDANRFKLSSITYEPCFVKIVMIITPPTDLPPLVSCGLKKKWATLAAPK